MKYTENQRQEIINKINLLTCKLLSNKEISKELGLSTRMIQYYRQIDKDINILDKKSNYNKNYRDINKYKISERERKWYQKNISKVKNKNQQYYLNNKDQIIRHNIEYQVKRSKSDIDYRMRKAISANIRSSLKRVNNRKITHTQELIGCSIKELRSHLESQFQDGMTWDNYGKWHIDHKKPCCSFDLSISEQQEQCFHYTNLQPLWAKDNLSKGGKLIF